MPKANADLKEYEKLEDDIIQEIAAAIGDLCDSEVDSSVIKDVQPPESVINAMARAAAVLIAFEPGYRLGG